MKAIILLFVGAMLLAMVSCEKNREATPGNYIPVNSCKKFSVEATQITCCLDSVIQDSRCPINAVCIWEGIGVARLNVTIQNETHKITLATRKYSPLPFTNDTTLAGYKIEFVDLLPAPELNKITRYDLYTAVMNITKL